MSFLLVSVSYPSNRYKKPQLVSHMSAVLFGVAEHIISKSQPKYRAPSNMFCSLLSALRKIRNQVTRWLKKWYQQLMFPLLCSDSNTPHYFFFLIKIQGETGDGCSAMITRNGPSISQNQNPSSYVALWFCLDVISSIPILSQKQNKTSMPAYLLRSPGLKYSKMFLLLNQRTTLDHHGCSACHPRNGLSISRKTQSPVAIWLCGSDQIKSFRILTYFCLKKEIRRWRVRCLACSARLGQLKRSFRSRME